MQGAAHRRWCDAEACAQHAVFLYAVHARLAERPPDIIGDLPRFLYGCIGQEQRKLLSADPGGISRRIVQHIGQLLDDPVAHRVTVTIVDPLEMVDIAQHQQRALAVDPHLLERSSVEQARQIVPLGPVTIAFHHRHDHLGDQQGHGGRADDRPKGQDVAKNFRLGEIGERRLPAQDDGEQRHPQHDHDRHQALHAQKGMIQRMATCPVQAADTVSQCQKSGDLKRYGLRQIIGTHGQQDQRADGQQHHRAVQPCRGRPEQKRGANGLRKAPMCRWNEHRDGSRHPE